MSFLSKSKDLGIGTRGPYGRQVSGGERLGNMLQSWANEERESGFNKAVAGAAKSGEITPEMMIQISERWEVPLNEVMKAAKPINEERETTRLNNFAKSFSMRLYSYASENPQKQPKPQELIKMMKEGGGDPDKDGPMAMAIMQKMISAKDNEIKDVAPGHTLTEIRKNIRGETTANPFYTAPDEKKDKSPTEAELTQLAAKGDKEAQFLLDAMNRQAMTKGAMQSRGKIQGLLSEMGGLEGVTQAVVDGRETIENVKNTFGVPVQEIVRDKALKKDKEMSFIAPREVVKNLTASLGNQEKQRGMMGSFVRNINFQVDRVDEIMQDINRWGIRGLDLPKRELIKRVKGSGKEITLDAYLTEISNEINKLSQGSQASIAQLGEESQKRWNKIHDPNLSIKEMKTILDETKNMANMRLQSADSELDFTRLRLENVRKGGSLQRSLPETQAGSLFEILSVEE